MRTANEVASLLSGEFIRSALSPRYRAVLDVDILTEETRNAVTELMAYTSDVEIRRQVDRLLKAANHCDVEATKAAMRGLSGRTRSMLARRRIAVSDWSSALLPESVSRTRRRPRLLPIRQASFPTEADLDDPASRQEAFERLRQFAATGGAYPTKLLTDNVTSGRDTNDRQALVRAGRWEWNLYAPAKAGKGRPIRDEGRQFVTDMRLAFIAAHPDGIAPARTANYDNPGPFARFLIKVIHECPISLDVIAAIRESDVLRKRSLHRANTMRPPRQGKKNDPA